MSDWMPLWLFAAAVTVGLALLTLGGLLGALLGVVWAFVLFPHGAGRIMRRSGADRQADYWRTSRWQSGAR